MHTINSYVTKEYILKSRKHNKQMAEDQSCTHMYTDIKMKRKKKSEEFEKEEVEEELSQTQIKPAFLNNYQEKRFVVQTLLQASLKQQEF